MSAPTFGSNIHGDPSRRWKESAKTKRRLWQATNGDDIGCTRSDKEHLSWSCPSTWYSNLSTGPELATNTAKCQPKSGPASTRANRISRSLLREEWSSLSASTKRARAVSKSSANFIPNFTSSMDEGKLLPMSTPSKLLRQVAPTFVHLLTVAVTHARKTNMFKTAAMTLSLASASELKIFPPTFKPKVSCSYEPRATRFHV